MEAFYEKAKGKVRMDGYCRRKGTNSHTKAGKGNFDISPGDTLILLGDEKRGMAMPPKSAFAQFAAAVFDTEENSEESE